MMMIEGRGRFHETFRYRSSDEATSTNSRGNTHGLQYPPMAPSRYSRLLTRNTQQTRIRARVIRRHVKYDMSLPIINRQLSRPLCHPPPPILPTAFCPRIKLQIRTPLFPTPGHIRDSKLRRQPIRPHSNKRTARLIQIIRLFVLIIRAYELRDGIRAPVCNDDGVAAIVAGIAV